MSPSWIGAIRNRLDAVLAFTCLNDSIGMVENYIYWCIGSLSDSPGNQIRYSSLLQGLEKAAVALGWLKCTGSPNSTDCHG